MPTWDNGHAGPGTHPGAGVVAGTRTGPVRD